MKKKVNVVLLPGWKNDHKSLEIFSDKLKDIANLHFIDLPILINNQALNIDDYIFYLNEKIKDLDNVFLLGHSFGGKIASFYALKYEIKGLILLAPSTYIKKSFLIKIKLILNRLFNIFHIKKPKCLKGSKDYLSLNIKEKETFKNVLKYLNKKDLYKINIPAILFAFKGDKSVLVNDVNYINKNIKNSKMYVFKGDHFAYIDNILEIAYLIREFINGNS